METETTVFYVAFEHLHSSAQDTALEGDRVRWALVAQGAPQEQLQGCLPTAARHQSTHLPVVPVLFPSLGEYFGMYFHIDTSGMKSK